MYDQTYFTKDAPKTPTVEIDDNTVLLNRVDPYGHIFLSLAKGELPEKYRGAYTTMTLASHAAQMYGEDRKRAALDLVAEGTVSPKKK